MLHEAAQLSAGPTESIESIQLRESEAVCIITTTGNNNIKSKLKLNASVSVCRNL